jgi:hypothetical protein
MSVKEATGESAEESVSASSACSGLCAAAAAASVAGCSEHHHHATASVGQIDRLAEAAANAPGPLGGLAAGEDSYSALPCLCLSGGPGQAAQGAVSALPLSRGAEYFAHDAVSGLRFSQGARSVSLALFSRCQGC